MFSPLKKSLLLALLFALIAGCTPGTPSPTPIQSLINPPAGGKAGSGSYKKTDCPFTIPKDATDVTAECATLTVPEDYSKPYAKTIDLPVAIYRSTDGNKAAEPMLFLFSNPGPVLNFSWQIHYAFSDLNAKYTFVFLEQRGVGYSKPVLDCPDVDALFLNTLDKDPNSKEVTDQATNLQAACHQKLVNDGVSLTAYSTASSATDLDNLRQALGFSRWNIFSIGYGTSLAAELMRSYPQTVKSVVFQAMLPTDYSLFLSQASSADAAIQLLFKRCSDDTNCGKTYPDLQTTFDADVDELNAHPITVDATEPSSGHIFSFWVNGDRLIGLVLMALDSGTEELITEVPRLIYQVKNKNQEQLKAFLGSYAGNNNPSSVGMGQRIYCVEYLGSSSVQKVMDANAKASRRISDYFNRQVQGQADGCVIWQADNKSKPFTPPQVLKSDIPALILVGDYGWSTPVDWSAQAAKNLSRSTLVVFPSAGQVSNFFSQWMDCSNGLVRAFYANPGSKLDVSCAAVKNTTRWITLP